MIEEKRPERLLDKKQENKKKYEDIGYAQVGNVSPKAKLENGRTQACRPAICDCCDDCCC